MNGADIEEHGGVVGFVEMFRIEFHRKFSCLRRIMWVVGKDMQYKTSLGY